MAPPPLPPSARTLPPRPPQATPFRTPTSKRFPPATPRSHGGAATEHPVEVVARVRNLTTGASALEVPGGGCGTTVRVRGDAGGCRDFSLDGVSLSEEEGLESFYRRFVRSRVDGVRVAGAKCTVMVYGPTASGKSHTMFGCANQPGIVYLALRDLLDDDGGGGGCGEGGAQGPLLQVTVLEIYNEQVYDLLVGSGTNTPKVRLEVMGKKTKNATYISGNEAGKISREVAKVEKRCTVKSTLCNERSSRSHCMIILDVPSVGGRLMLVDMAGSENIEAAGQTGFEAKLQTAKINQGNTTLKRVVESIANGDLHVPYRDSKLTMLLQDSFEDDKSKILMILCASPDPKELHKTVSTLEYGAKAKCIIRAAHASTPRVKKNSEESSSMLNSRIKAINQFISKLQKENKQMEKERNEAQTVLGHKEEELAQVREKLQLIEEEGAVANEKAKFLKSELQMMEEKMIRQQQELLADAQENKQREKECNEAKTSLRHMEKELAQVRAELEGKSAAAKEKANNLKSEMQMMRENMLRQEKELLTLQQRLQEAEREKLETCQPVQQDIVGELSEMAAGGDPAMSISNEAGAEPHSYILMRATTLTMQQREKVDEKLQAIQCEFPIFVKVISKDNLLRMEFAMKYASACLTVDHDQTMILRVEGKRKLWRTRLHIHARYPVREIRRQEWHDFVVDNHVKVGDICLFELMKRCTKSVTMMVHLIRKSEIDT